MLLIHSESGPRPSFTTVSAPRHKKSISTRNATSNNQLTLLRTEDSSTLNFPFHFASHPTTFCPDFVALACCDSMPLKSIPLKPWSLKLASLQTMSLKSTHQIMFTYIQNALIASTEYASETVPLRIQCLQKRFAHSTESNLYYVGFVGSANTTGCIEIEYRIYCLQNRTLL